MFRNYLQERIDQSLATAQVAGLIGCVQAIEPAASPETTERILRLLHTACTDPDHACVAVAPGVILFGFAPATTPTPTDQPMAAWPGQPAMAGKAEEMPA